MTRFIRTMVITLATLTLTLGAAHAADKVQKLNWEDLRPQSEMESKPLDLNADGTVTDEELAMAPKYSPAADATVPELNGKRVRIPAFIVPLDGDQKALTELLLVPYFGACTHVPPPPPNQIIHVKPEGEGVAIGDLDIYEPVFATGIIKTEDINHDLAEIGYRMSIEKLEPYDPNK